MPHDVRVPDLWVCIGQVKHPPVLQERAIMRPALESNALPLSVQKNIADKLYDKRKLAALEIEQLVKSLAQKGEADRITELIDALNQFALSSQVGLLADTPAAPPSHPPICCYTVVQSPQLRPVHLSSPCPPLSLAPHSPMLAKAGCWVWQLPRWGWLLPLRGWSCQECCPKSCRPSSTPSQMQMPVCGTMQ